MRARSWPNILFLKILRFEFGYLSLRGYREREKERERERERVAVSTQHGGIPSHNVGEL